MRTLIALVFCISLPAFAAAPPRGSERLRELAVFPQINWSFNTGLQFQGDRWALIDNRNATNEIYELRKELNLEPNDIRKLLELGYLLENNNDTNESQICYEKAVKLGRNKVAANPDDSAALDDLAEALSTLGEDDEAESLYRKATVVSPHDWRCWVNFANFFAVDFFLWMYPENLRASVVVGRQPPQAVLDYRPSEEALKKAEDALKETSQCFDKAIAITPKEPEIYIQRAGYMIVSNWENCFFSYYRGNEKIDSSKWAMFQLSKETIADTKTAAELSPENCDLIGLGAALEWMAAASRANSTNLTRNMLPDGSRKSIDNAMARLGNLSQNPDAKVAAGALEYLGFLDLTFGNSREAATYFRRAVELDPKRDECWDLLLSATSDDTGFSDEAVAICKSRLKAKNSAQNHLFLAKAYALKNEWSLSAGEAEIAANLDTNSVIAPLILAAIDLKQSDRADRLPEAKGQLDHAYELSSRSSNAESWQRWREINLDGAIYYGLQRTPDSQKTAKLVLDQVLKYYPNDQTAKAILEALPGESPSAEAKGD